MQLFVLRTTNLYLELLLAETLNKNYRGKNAHCYISRDWFPLSMLHVRTCFRGMMTEGN